MRDNRITNKPIFSQAQERKEVFIKKTKEKVTRAEARKHLAQFHLSCELLKVIRRFFPGLLSLLKQIRDPRDQRYITYQCQVLLMTRILSTIFYISSMRKTSEEFNSEIIIENIGYLSGQELTELSYWETINDYLKGVDPEELQDTVCRLVKKLIRSRAFERARWLLAGHHRRNAAVQQPCEAGREMPAPRPQQRGGDGIYRILLLCAGSKNNAAPGYLCEHHDRICGEPGRGGETGL